MSAVTIHAGCTLLQLVFTTHSFIIPLSPSPILFLLLFLSQRPKHPLSPSHSTCSLAAGCLLGSLRSAHRCISFDCRRVLETCLPPIASSTRPSLSVTVNSPTNSTCKPPSRCCLSYYDNLRPAWDIFKIKVNLFRICRFGTTTFDEFTV